MTYTPSLILTFAALVLLPLARVRAVEPKPNVLIILTDDQGYADAGFQGSKDIPTPNMDRLAAEGLRCTSGYVSHPYCSPSRAGLMTGRYQARFGHEHNPVYDPLSHTEGLPLTERLLPEVLRNAGYSTGWIGKWHLGSAPEFRPENRGFQETFGFLSGMHRYLGWTPKPDVEFCLPILRNGKDVEEKEHLTLAFGREASDFIGRHKDAPWFLYLAFNAPHAPNEPTAERLERFKAIPDEKRRSYAAQMSLLDDAVGEVLSTLQRTGQDRRTLVFFLSDNGAPVGSGNGGIASNGGDNGVLRDGKHSVYEGGVRVPFVVSWPGHLPEGKDYAYPVSSLDVFATALASAGIRMPKDRPYDGINLLPYLGGERAGPPHDRLFWRLNERLQAAALMDGKKLVREGTQPEQLYDFSSDTGESTNKAGSDIRNLGKLNKALDDWFGRMSKKLAFQGQQGPEKEWPDRQEKKVKEGKESR